MPWRYQPADNRTPVNHLLFGHLEWGTVLDDPRCANDPNFVEVKPKASKPKAPKKPAAKKSAPAKSSTPPAASGTDSPADAKSASEPPAAQADAGAAGRS